MATIVQSNYSVLSGSSPNTVALTSNAMAGNTIILAIGWFDAGTGSLPLPTDANGTYSTAFNPALNSISNAVACFYVPNCTGGVKHSTTIQGLGVAPDTNFFSDAAIYEVSGLTTTPLDKTNTATTVNGGSGQTSQSTGSTGTLTQANEFAFVAMSFDDNPGVANEGILVPSGYTVDPNIPSSFQDTAVNIGLQVGWKEISSTAALNPSFTWTAQSGLTSAYAGIATFLEASASAVGINLSQRGPGRSPSNLARFQQFRLSTQNPITDVLLGQICL